MYLWVLSRLDIVKLRQDLTLNLNVQHLIQEKVNGKGNVNGLDIIQQANKLSKIRKSRVVRHLTLHYI